MRDSPGAEKSHQGVHGKGRAAATISNGEFYRIISIEIMFPWESKSFSRLYVKRPPTEKKKKKSKRNKELFPGEDISDKKELGKKNASTKEGEDQLEKFT